MWLYTLVSADYDGTTLMPHLLEHYYGLKVPYSRMLVNVHHNPEKYDRVGLDMILGTCASYRVYCRYVTHVAWPNCPAGWHHTPARPQGTFRGQV